MSTPWTRELCGVNWDPNNPAPMLIGAQETPGGSFGPYVWIHYNQNAVNWIKANINDQMVWSQEARRGIPLRV